MKGFVVGYDYFVMYHFKQEEQILSKQEHKKRLQSLMALVNQIGTRNALEKGADNAFEYFDIDSTIDLGRTCITNKKL